MAGRQCDVMRLRKRIGTVLAWQWPCMPQCRRVTACSGPARPLLASVPRVKIVRVSTSGAPAGNAFHEQAAVAATCCRILRSSAIKEST